MSSFIQRYSESDRVNHWIVAISFILAGLSGLAFFHPSMFWLVNLFGGGPWARILHPFIGVVMFAFFLALAFRFWNHNRLNDNDRKWLSKWRDVLNNREENLPEVGRYNAGQKVLFWVMVGCVTVLAVTGFIFWRPYFADAFPIGLVRLCTLLHSLAAFILILGIIVHIYAAIWVKGTTRAMTRGTVSKAWAAKHHPGWYREMSK
ncbi:MAG TPA: formate dehydrogenase subunit gamma [Burkholderiales bacterium]|nr:formate dehydrogenase subunit gamma [Burkholderiales bacterium]